MLTVRIIYPDGMESIKEVRTVMVNPPKQSPTGAAMVTFWRPDKDSEPEDVLEGDVYVMNENGKTIASYNIRKPPLKL
jgi:hypothetical protein